MLAYSKCWTRDKHLRDPIFQHDGIKLPYRGLFHRHKNHPSCMSKACLKGLAQRLVLAKIQTLAGALIVTQF